MHIFDWALLVHLHINENILELNVDQCVNIEYGKKNGINTRVKWIFRQFYAI